MDEVSNYLIPALISSLTGALAAILVARYSKTHEQRKDESRNLSAKTESEIVIAAKELVTGSAEASKAVAENLLRTIEYLKHELVEVKAEKTAALIDSKDIRADNLEKEKRINRLEEMIIHQSEYIDTQNTALKKAGIDVPLNGEIMDSVRRLKLTREQREQLKRAGK